MADAWDREMAELWRLGLPLPRALRSAGARPVIAAAGPPERVLLALAEGAANVSHPALLLRRTLATPVAALAATLLLVAGAWGAVSFSIATPKRAAFGDVLTWAGIDPDRLTWASIAAAGTGAVLAFVAARRGVERLPLLGPAVRRLRLARCFHTLASLLEQGVAPRDAVPVALVASGSGPMVRAAVAVGRALGRDEPLTATLVDRGLLTPDLAATIAIAECSEQLAHACRALGERLAAEVASDIDTLRLIAWPGTVAGLVAIAGGATAVLLYPSVAASLAP